MSAVFGLAIVVSLLSYGAEALGEAYGEPTPIELTSSDLGRASTTVTVPERDDSAARSSRSSNSESFQASDDDDTPSRAASRAERIDAAELEAIQDEFDAAFERAANGPQASTAQSPPATSSAEDQPTSTQRTAAPSTTKTTAPPTTTSTAPPTTTTTAPPTTTTTAPPTTTTTEPEPTTTTSSTPASGSETGGASWYDHRDGICAHKTLEFGTIVTVRNLENGKTTTCEVGDRGPFIAGRIIDLDDAEFDDIASLDEGVIDVQITW